MTKKHYKAIAECIALSRCPEIGVFYKAGFNACRYNIALHLADYCEQDNPRFDRQKFMNACYKANHA